MKIILLLTWPHFLNDLYLICLGTKNLGVLWALDLLFYTLIPVATFLILVRRKKLILSDVGICGPIRFSTFLAGIAMCVGLVLVVRWFISPITFALIPGRLCYGYVFPEQQPIRSLTIVYAAVSAALVEETLSVE